MPRPDGTYDVGDAAIVRLAVDEVCDPTTNVVIQNPIPSGVQFRKLSLSEGSVEFDSRYDDADDRAGLQLKDLGKFFPWFKKSGLPSKTVDDIKLQVAGDETRFNDARALALCINPNRREPDGTQILYAAQSGDSNVSGEYNEAIYKGKGHGSDGGCYSCGSKFHMACDCPLGKGKNKKGTKEKESSKDFGDGGLTSGAKARVSANPLGGAKEKDGKGKSKGYGRKGHSYTTISRLVAALRSVKAVLMLQPFKRSDVDCSSTLEQHLVLLAELADAQELLYGQDGDQQEQDHSCPALAGNPTLRGLGAWFENGDGLNTKDQEAMDAEGELTTVKARKNILQDMLTEMREPLVKLEDENAELKQKQDSKTSASSQAPSMPAPVTPKNTDEAELKGEMVEFKDHEIARQLARAKSLKLSEAFHITKKGKKFHRDGCPHLLEGTQLLRLRYFLATLK
ncbi:Integrase catalytic domain-containing protein [Durusdinium trenchii]|uniref:Integrase catalytic domain-containing protein n=1 Tax=Durusdinium trenchii TaxID=1381693 RepID=A0ABP0SJS8_9DINO